MLCFHFGVLVPNIGKTLTIHALHTHNTHVLLFIFTGIEVPKSSQNSDKLCGKRIIIKKSNFSFFSSDSYVPNSKVSANMGKLNDFT